MPPVALGILLSVFHLESDRTDMTVVQLCLNDLLRQKLKDKYVDVNKGIT